MKARAPSETIRFSVAADVGGIEVIHAAFNRRGVPPHIHDEYSVSVPLRGGLAFDYHGSKHSAPSGVISCTPPGEVHNAYAAQGAQWEFICLLIPAPVVLEILSGADRAEQLPDLPERVISDPGLAQRLVALHSQLEVAGDLLDRQSACTLVFADFFRRHSSAACHLPNQVQTCNRPVQRARELLHGCYAGPIPLARLASHVGLSPYYFLRMFRAAVGLTPHMYLNQIRIMEAKRKLAEGMSPAEAALCCGFCDQSHMARQFKRTTLVTPGQYQNAFGR